MLNFGMKKPPTVLEGLVKTAAHELRGLDVNIRTGNNDPKSVPAATRASDGVQTLTVEAIDNHVYFYSGVDSDRILALIRMLRDQDQRLRNERLSRGLDDNFPHTPIWLHINSGGGDLFSGLAIADQLRQIVTPIYSVIEGFAASAATLISMACTKRYILPNSFMMIHQLSSSSWLPQTYEQNKDEIAMQDMAMDKLRDFYALYSNQDRDAITELLKHDSWMDANGAVEKGFVDEVLGQTATVSPSRVIITKNTIVDTSGTISKKK